uniref:FBD domain-containing protein n=1 Tax=Arundo donax TaxID=35708 RepID=A0A0A9HFM4_ARUDO
MSILSFQAQNTCSPGCVCGEPRNWETEEFSLDSLHEVAIYGWSGAECDFAFLKRLLKWAAALKTITITFNPAVTVSKELCPELLSLCGPETCMKVFLYRNGAKVMYGPVG